MCLCVLNTLTLRAEHQSAWMSNIAHYGLTWSSTGCFIAVSVWQQRALNWFINVTGYAEKLC